MLARRSVAGKEPVTWSGKSDLISECTRRDRSQWDFCQPVLHLRIWNPDGGVGNVHLTLPHGQKFLVDPQTGLRKDANDVA